MKGSNLLGLCFELGDSFGELVRACLVPGDYSEKHVQFHLLHCRSSQLVVGGRHFQMDQHCLVEPGRVVLGQGGLQVEVGHFQIHQHCPLEPGGQVQQECC